MHAASREFDQAIRKIPHIEDQSAMQKYLMDASYTDDPVTPKYILRPDSTEQLAEAVRICHEHGQPYVVQGGMTGLAGGATVQAGEVVITLERMNKIEDLDTAGGTVCVQAGMTLESLCQAVEAQGWYFPLDLGARGSCTIGGNVSTNAGGNRVLRYGPTRDLVLGIEVVLSDGTVLNMLRRLLKNNTGLDLKHLFIGTEGRYGIISRVTLRLFPKPEVRASALLAVAGFDEMTQLLKQARHALPDLSSYEVMWESYVKRACAVIDREVPFQGAYPMYILLETEGRDEPGFHERFNSFLETAIEKQWAEDAIIPQTIEQGQRLWDIRDAIAILLRIWGDNKNCISYDISIALKDMKAFLDVCIKDVEEGFPEAEHMLFGHLGDGNLHLIVGNLQKDELDKIQKVTYQHVADFFGSVTAEHGIGVWKKPYLHYSRSEDEIRLMEQIRQLLNPSNLLNAGRVID